MKAPILEGLGQNRSNNAREICLEGFSYPRQARQNPPKDFQARILRRKNLRQPRLDIQMSRGGRGPAPKLLHSRAECRRLRQQSPKFLPLWTPELPPPRTFEPPIWQNPLLPNALSFLRFQRKANCQERAPYHIPRFQFLKAFVRREIRHCLQVPQSQRRILQQAPSSPFGFRHTRRAKKPPTCRLLKLQTETLF